jgi:hypothetical protein
MIGRRDGEKKRATRAEAGREVEGGKGVKVNSKIGWVAGWAAAPLSETGSTR